VGGRRSSTPNATSSATPSSAAFGRFKQWRGIATRYGKYARTYAGGVLLPPPSSSPGHELQRHARIADGRSNPEIAARLFILAKTASVHVPDILAKVGVASRGARAPPV
jgi:hypothetical protein